ncbi:MAG: dethiobiotin synthase [Verrucomicrobiae bacterium]|nr:dethiobiotin synthase [Verrucomicrobiae bacterium]
MKQRRSAALNSVLFITGTDTGVGKTVLTGLLLAHARARGWRAVALKPLCTGGREDALTLSALQGHALPLDVVNPWWSSIPLTPAIALRGKRKKPNKHAVLAHLRAVAQQADWVLVEGAGGLRSPLGEDFDALELMAALRCGAVVVARNRLGCLNHVLMTVELLRQRRVPVVAVVLQGEKTEDLSARTNARFLRKKAGFPPVFTLPWLGARAGDPAAIKKNEKKLKKTLARILAFAKKRAAL